jgi:hypothetical protein
MDTLGECLTPEVAARIVDLRASGDLQERLEILADRCTEGQLTDEEKSEYESYIHLIDFISILQAKARAMLREVAAR